MIGEGILAMDQANTKRGQISISVRGLVEFLGRRGDIGDRTIGRDALGAMQAGSRIHRKLQKTAGHDYHPELPLELVVDMGDYDLVITGRADGVIYKEGESGGPDPSFPVIIDEIKGMYLDVLTLEEPVPVHLDQAKAYAYIFALQKGLDQIRVQMTYVSLDTEEVRQFCLAFDFAEIQNWFSGEIEAYRRWSDFRFHWKKVCKESIRKMDFPYEYRPGQKKLAADVYRSIHRRKILYIQAPTGVGKTLSTIFPALKAMGEGEVDRIFYLTAKSMTRRVARETIQLLADRGYRGKTTEIMAREKLCLLEHRSCNPKDCPYARGHYDRINDVLYEGLTSRDLFDRDSLVSLAEDRQVCPYALCLDLASFSDNILCDYNYVFDPNVCLSSLLRQGEKREDLFLVDEAHNLVDRARQMYSEVLYKNDFLDLRRAFRGRKRKLVLGAGRCSRFFTDRAREQEGDQILEQVDPFVFSLMNVAAEISSYLEEGLPVEEHEQVLDIYFRIRYFLSITDWLDDHYVISLESHGRNAAIHLYCIDPSFLLSERIARARSCVFFSATLLPIRYYKKLLSTDREAYAIYAESVFSEDRRGLFIASDISSRYKERGPVTYQRYAAYIRKISLARGGNYIVFFPSYQFLRDVLQEFTPIQPEDCRLIVQERKMSELDMEHFLDRFREREPGSLLAFCVTGGIFSEGIDLTGESLIGAIIVGVPLPQVNRYTTILKNYFDRRTSAFGEGEGYDYAYLYPGMSKVLQAAGRVIRTESDRGLIALLDDRFLREDYMACFPREWRKYQRIRLNHVEDRLGDFWKALDP